LIDTTVTSLIIFTCCGRFQLENSLRQRKRSTGAVSLCRRRSK